MNIKGKRFVVFLDIMGFKERVARNSADDLYKELTAFNRDIVKIISSVSNVETERGGEQEGFSDAALISNDAQDAIMLAQFSDSIVLFSNDDSPRSLQMISRVAAGIMMSAIHREKPIPLKGALAEGHITCDMSKQLFFGQALIDAYLLEENVQYYGIIVHHSAEETVKNMQSDLFANLKSPLKSGFIEHYNILWWKDSTANALEGLDRVRLLVSDSPRRYVDNTKVLIGI